MNKTISILFLLIFLCSFEAKAQDGEFKLPDNYKACLQEYQDQFVPKGYCMQEKIVGDLNKDGLDDYILLVQDTSEEGWDWNQWETVVVNKNRRGVIIALNQGNGKYKVHTQNLSFLESDNEDSGVYYAPELSINITQKGTIQFHYSHGRYGHWFYTFRYQNDKFECIGFESHYNRGPIPLSITSYNLSTMKVCYSENILAEEIDENGYYDEKWKETWSKMEMTNRPDLATIEDINGLSIK